MDVAVFDGRGFAALLEPLRRKFANCLQHQEARFTEVRKPAKETLVSELIQGVYDLTADLMLWATHCLQLLQAPAARKDREASEQPALLRVEQVVAPLDRVSKRLLPAGQVTSPAAERAQRLRKPGQQSLRRKQLDARRRQL